MILSFKSQFKSKILAGTKTQTIREDKKGRWKVGQTIHFAVNMYTKKQETFKIATVASITEVAIFNISSHKVISLREGHKWRGLENEEMRKFIFADGFNSEEEFWGWFDKPAFYGKVIRWEK